MWSLIHWALYFGSAEGLLKARANGGAVVFVRALWSSAILFSVGIALEQRLAPGATWSFSGAALRSTIVQHLSWFGAVFGATYAALYARFASQWTYLADLYNRIMASQVQFPRGDDRRRERAYTVWWAAFIEDAEDVHLALKPSYAAVIAGLLGDPNIRAIYRETTVNGERRIAALENRLKHALSPAQFQRLYDAGASLAEARRITLLLRSAP